MRPHLLLTNDDGARADGLNALADALVPYAQVSVVAPRTEQSGVGRHISLRTPLRASQFAPGRWSVDGTPTDCVYLALNCLLETPPDLVVSGINHGPNLGEDVWYSGTANAALEAASSGIRAIAMSQTLWPDAQWPEIGSVAAGLVLDFWSHWPTGAECLNVNFPERVSPDAIKWCWAPLGERDYQRSVVTHTDPHGRPYYWIAGTPRHAVSQVDTDGARLSEGWITVTPLNRNATDWETLKSFLQHED